MWNKWTLIKYEEIELPSLPLNCLCSILFSISPPLFCDSAVFRFTDNLSRQISKNIPNQVVKFLLAPPAPPLLPQFFCILIEVEVGVEAESCLWNCRVMDGGTQYNPRTVEEVFRDFKGRRAAIIKALTTGYPLPFFLLIFFFLRPSTNDLLFSQIFIFRSLWFMQM